MKFSGADFIIFLLISGLPSIISGQSTVRNESGADAEMILQKGEEGEQKIRDFYFNSVNTPLEILNGKEYINYFFRGTTTPLLFSNHFFTSTLDFNKRLYHNVKLQYDTYLDEVLFTDTSRMINFEYPRVALNKELADGFSFYFQGEFYNFRHIRFQTRSRDNPGDGFYDLVYEGPSMFIIKHRSRLYEKDAVNEYKYAPVKYVYIDGSFKKFVRLKDLAGFFGPREEEIRAYIRENRIRTRKTPKGDIAGILKYYDSLLR
jgi:hypothetical protein